MADRSTVNKPGGGKPSASERARRLLALLPYLRGQGTRRLADLAAATGSDEATVAADLTTLSLCGADERDPNSLVAVLVEGDEAIVFGDLPALEEPVRLTEREANALLAALEAFGAGPESDLVGRLAAVSAAGAEAERLGHGVRAALAPDAVAHTLARLAGLASVSSRARITYTRLGETAARERVVHPLRFLLERGAWYMLAWDEGADSERTFRLDRVGSVEPAGGTFERPEWVPSLSAAAPDPATLPRAEIVFAHEAPDFDQRSWPGATFEIRSDGTVAASVPYSGTRWIARKVVSRLGEAVVVSPQEVREAVAELAKTESGA